MPEPRVQSKAVPLSVKPQDAQVRVLTLNHGEYQDSTLYRLEKGSYLQFKPGSSLMGCKVLLYCNYSSSTTQQSCEFVRNLYNVLEWHRPDPEDPCAAPTLLGSGVLIQDTDVFCEILVSLPGSFHFYYVYENSGKTVGPQGSGYFHVTPTLKYGRNKQEQLPLDCIQAQTVLSKSLGPFNTWENKLRVAKETGYNMIHFTPVQELGASNSGYSLADQLKTNPLFSAESGRVVSFDDIEKLISKLRNEWKIVSICDIVLNHTANESKWLLEHPEATYNIYNCPHLRPAFLLDAILAKLTDDVGRGDYENVGVPRRVTQSQHLDAIKHLLKATILPEVKIQELYMCNVNDVIQEFFAQARNGVSPVPANAEVSENIKLIQDPQYRRLKSTIDMELALRLYNVYRSDCFDEDTRLKRCIETLKVRLEELNHGIFNEIQNHLENAIDNCVAGMRYFRIQADGPKIEEVSVKNPLVPKYFTFHGQALHWKEMESKMYSLDAHFLMAHNGWVMNADPLKDFANVRVGTANVYLRRELIAWGDSVKLRYGDKPEDVPFLWKHMREYVELTARIFDGVRLDNCHSTPLPVAEYMLDCARRVKPDLYVVAELFTNSDLTDNIFVNRLGITSLIREALSAWDSHEQGRLVYRYGGNPAGALMLPSVRVLTPSIAHAIFLDLTHDNPAPVEKRSVFDLLPSSALVSMACCASGSNRGYDELVPHHIHVVDEIRQYAEWAADYGVNGTADESTIHVDLQSGIIAAKKALNHLHFDLGSKGYDQVYVDQMDSDIVAVTRHNPRTHQTVILVAFTAFSQPDIYFGGKYVKPLRFEGKLDEIILEANLRHSDYKNNGKQLQPPKNFSKDANFINGLTEYELYIKQNILLSQSAILQPKESRNGNYTILEFKDFIPGSVIAIQVSMHNHTKPAFQKLDQLAEIFNLSTQDDILNKLCLTNIISKLSLSDLNACLYVCDQEEKDSGGSGVYDIPGYGPLVYAGLQGFESLLNEIRLTNDLGHPLCNNLREGNWMLDYIWQRLERFKNLTEISRWYQSKFQPLREIPRYLIPCYFDMIVRGIYDVLVKACLAQMSDFIRKGSSLEKSLALGSVQCCGLAPSASLPTFSPSLSPLKISGRPLLTQNDRQIPVLSAGLPHFSAGYMRCWGRDTFISLRGLFILTGRYEDARNHILGFAACLRHGLIPNLLDSGRTPRFNCRDAIWWWLYGIKGYCLEAPEGYNILQDMVSRIFPTDDSQPLPPGQVDQPLFDVIQEALNVHFQGLIFRERNAGRDIDAHMTDKGFNNQIGIHPDTGFVFGGNEDNCGTWMDKMGSSAVAGNKGKPGTPRDGSAVELVGLSKSVVSWLGASHTSGKYPYQGVQRKHSDGTVTTWSFMQWADKIQKNFERFFWIHTSPAANDLRPDLIHRRGIYKDCYGATQPWTDFQLRCNFPITMAVAPELFNNEHAWVALDSVKNILLGPLGVKTLDPEDWGYCGDYDNDNQSSDPKVAHGFNYHQGPEWLWPMGYYLRARLHFAHKNGCLGKTIAEIRSVLSRHVSEILSSHWRGLPELTNSSGKFCPGSCNTQAWSMATILEVLFDLRQWENEKLSVLSPDKNYEN